MRDRIRVRDRMLATEQENERRTYIAAEGWARFGSTAGSRDGVTGIITSWANRMNSDSQDSAVDCMFSSVTSLRKVKEKVSQL